MRSRGDDGPLARWISRLADTTGQATAEYALVMLAAAAVAGGVLAWVVGTDAVGRLMEAVLESIIADVSG